MPTVFNYFNLNFSLIGLFKMLCVFSLLQLSGFKKVVNYTKKVMEDARYRKTISREEVHFPFYTIEEIAGARVSSLLSV